MTAPAGAAGILVREADIEAERADLVSALHQFLTPYLTADQNETRFAWLYESSPHGTPRVWTARHPGGEVLGVAAAFPRRLWVEDREEQGWVLGDFCIHPSQRSLGPAVRLQKVFLDEARTDRLRFWYDFPNPGMIAVYRRMGIAPTHEEIRFAKPLRIDAKLEAIVRSRLLASLLAAPANWLLGVASGPPRDRGGHEVAMLEGPCGAEFTGLFHEIRGRVGLAADRTAEYLNWRFRSDPFHEHSFLTVRRQGVLRGYAVLARRENATHVLDLVGTEEPAALAALLGETVRAARRAGHETVSFPLVAGHPHVSLLRTMGFHPRESFPVVCGGSASSACLAFLAKGGRWHLTDGDRDS